MPTKSYTNYFHPHLNGVSVDATVDFCILYTVYVLR